MATKTMTVQPSAEADSKLSKQAKKEQLRRIYMTGNKRKFEMIVMAAFWIMWPYYFYTEIFSNVSSAADLAASACYFVYVLSLP